MFGDEEIKEMANTITFEMTENQAKNFESLFEEFNQTMKRINENERSRNEQVNKLRAGGRKPLWEI